MNIQSEFLRWCSKKIHSESEEINFNLVDGFNWFQLDQLVLADCNASLRMFEYLKRRVRWRVVNVGFSGLGRFKQHKGDTGLRLGRCVLILWVLMQQICEPRSYFVHQYRNKFLVRRRMDHEQLRYEDCVLAQGALIQVQQGLGKYMATKTLQGL